MTNDSSQLELRLGNSGSQEALQWEEDDEEELQLATMSLEQFVHFWTGQTRRLLGRLLVIFLADLLARLPTGTTKHLQAEMLRICKNKNSFYLK